MKLKVNQFIGRDNETETYPIDYLEYPLTVSLLSGDEVNLTLKGEVKIPEICARCGAKIKLALILDTPFTVGLPDSDWPAADGTVDSEELVAAAIQLNTPLIVYCKKCSK
ncbi:MAG: hypothetical protein Q7S64_00970 [bacterium]|nr:hypothetical protein [bacterium]